ncbi:MAG: tripartite tricarboxylate transporter substrate binding protein [Burkholderiales bacterium]
MSGRLLFAVAMAMAHTSPHAQPYPVKPIRLVVPTPPGGATDFVARVVAPKMAESLGQPLIIDNRVGASGIIGSEAVAKASADGYTILAVFDNFATNPYLFPNNTYDPVKHFTPISLIVKAAQVVVVTPGLGVKRYEDLVRLAQARGGALNYATAGPGTSSRLTVELLKLTAGIDPTAVHYKGGGPAMTALLGAQVDLMVVTLGTVLPHLKADKLIPLAVTSIARHPLLPEVPVLGDFHPGFEAQSWVGMLGPAGLSDEVVARLEAAVRSAIADPGVRERLQAQGYEVIGTTGGPFGQWLRTEGERWGRVIRERRITLE